MSADRQNPAQNPSTPNEKTDSAQSDQSRTSVTMFTVYVCAAIGGTIAAIADLIQKEQASAVLKMTSVSARHLNLEVQPLIILAVVILLGVLLCFVFQPGNRRAGFAVGAGVIASIMTVTPYRPLQSGEPAPEAAVPAETPSEAPSGAQGSQLNQLGTRSVQLAFADTKPQQVAMASTNVAVITVKNDLAVPVKVMVSFYDKNSKRAFEQVRAIAAGQTGSFEFSARPQRGKISGEYFLQVGGERSAYVPVTGNAPVRARTLSLTQAVPSFAQAQINKDALDSYNSTSKDSQRTASDSEVRHIYNKPTGLFNELQQKLLTPKKW